MGLLEFYFVSAVLGSESGRLHPLFVKFHDMTAVAEKHQVG